MQTTNTTKVIKFNSFLSAKLVFLHRQAFKCTFYILKKRQTNMVNWKIVAICPQFDIKKYG